MDRTKYQFNGQLYNKGKLVVAVVTEYANQAPRSLEDINNTFGAVAYDLKTGLARFAREGRKRHFIDFPIDLKSGQAVISTQWRPQRMSKFLPRAKEAGFKIKEIPQSGK